MLRKRNAKLHPISSYQNALHTLLKRKSDGLSSIEIAKFLNISNAKCEKLLYQEQLRETLDVDPYSGTLIYRSKLDISNNSLDEEIRIARKKYLLNRIKSMEVKATFTIGLSLLTIRIANVNIGLPRFKQQDSIPVIESKSETLIEDNNYDSINLEIERLNQIRQTLISGYNRETCAFEWNNSDTCYIQNRLYTKTEFENRLDSIEKRIKQIEKSL